MKKLTQLLIYFIISTTYASEINSIKGSIKGFVYDWQTNQPLEYATVSIKIKNEGTIVDGAITDNSGFFKLKNINSGLYEVKITFMGYETILLDSINVYSSSLDIDIGKVKLKPKVELLDELVVSSDRNTVTYKIDKKIIHVGRQYTSTAGTAIDILENYPSFSVDIDGIVSMRGSTSFTVLVDNRPSILEPSEILNQIPSNNIESIEVITNPSAKFDSEGSAGVINIITKKNILEGTNGMFSLNGGMFDTYGGDLLLNFKKEKLNYFIGANYNRRGIDGKLVSNYRTMENDTISFLERNGEYERRKGSQSIRGGIDYNFNDKNKISLQANYGKWLSYGKTDLDYREFTQPESSESIYNNFDEPDRYGNYYNVDFSYTHNFLKKGHRITSMLYFSNDNLVDEIKNELRDEFNEITSGQISKESGPAEKYTLKLDYTLPIASNHKLESGYHADIQKYNKVSELFERNDVTETYQSVLEYYNKVKFNKFINSAYLIFSSEVKKLGYQFGIRMEHTNREINVNDSDDYLIDRFDFFPTIHLTYKIDDKNEMMVSYTKRIRRPRDWQLEPFYTWADAYNIRIGNPLLKPQYVNSYELNYLNKSEKNTFSANAYYKKTHDQIERFKSVFDESIYLSSYENISEGNSLGMELMVSLGLIKWWDIDLSSNFYRYWIKGELFNENIDKSSINLRARFNNTFKIKKSTRIQLTGMYNSPSVSVQGDNQGYIMINGAVRQNITNDLSATLNCTGIFGLLKRERTFENANFYLYDYTEPYTPIFNFSLSYKFNNYKYDRKKHKRGRDLDNGEGSL